MNTDRLRQFIDGPDDLGPGQLGKYLIVREIGRGGMGIVYEAEDPELKRRIALKVLREDVGDNAFKRLHREASIAAQIRHPNIVSVHEVGPNFIAMELVEGRTLTDLQREGAASKAELVRILEEVARAAGFAHFKGIVHRDLKPSNVLVGKDGRVALTDFGLARAESFATRLTQSQAVMGTPQYMAPEQVEGRQHDIDARTDVYALGVMLYEILSGQVPFKADVPATLYQKILHDDPTPPSRLARVSEADLEVICLKAMEKERERRYADATEFADELARCRRGEAILARPASMIYRLKKKAARRKALLLTTAALALAAGVTLIVPLATRSWEFKRGRDEARKAFAAGDWARAVAECEGALALKQDPELAVLREDCRRRLGEAEERAKEAMRYRLMKETITPFEDAVKDARAYFYINGGGFLDKLKKVEDALAVLEKMSREPSSAKYAELWRALGMGWYFAGDSKRAEAALLEAERRAPEDGWVHFYLGRIYLERAMAAMLGGSRKDSKERRRGRARAWTDRALVHMRRPAQAWEGAEEIDRHIAETYRALAEGNDEELFRRCEEGLARFTDSLGTEEYFLLRAWVREETRIDDFTSALKRKPHYAWASFGRGRACQLAEKLDEAIADYTEAICVNPRLAVAYSNRGMARFVKGDQEEALADCEQALRLDPELAEAYSNRGSIRIRISKRDAATVDAALADFNEALRLNPELWEVYVNRGNAKLMKSDVAGALIDLDKAVEKLPDNPEAYGARGMAFLGARDRARAAEDLSKALELAPPDWSYRSRVEAVLKSLKP